MSAAEKRGAIIRKGNARLLKKGTGIMLDDERIEADRVIVTAGVWVKELFAPLGIDVDVTSQKAQIIHLNEADADTDECTPSPSSLAAMVPETWVPCPL